MFSFIDRFSVGEMNNNHRMQYVVCVCNCRMSNGRTFAGIHFAPFFSLFSVFCSKRPTQTAANWGKTQYFVECGRSDENNESLLAVVLVPYAVQQEISMCYVRCACGRSYVSIWKLKTIISLFLSRSGTHTDAYLAQDRVERLKKRANTIEICQHDIAALTVRCKDLQSTDA